MTATVAAHARERTIPPQPRTRPGCLRPGVKCHPGSAGRRAHATAAVSAATADTTAADAGGGMLGTLAVETQGTSDALLR